MKPTQIVLHALPEELLGWGETWIRRRAAAAVVIRISPRFSMTQVGVPDALRKDAAKSGIPFRVCIGKQAFDLQSTSLLEFMRKNTAECVLDIGALTSEGLKESSILITPTDESAKFWAGIVRELKKGTTAGLWAVSPATGARKYCKNNRYTEAAAAAFRNGVRLLPVAGWNSFEIGPEEQPGA